MAKYYIATFYNTQGAIKAESMLRKENIRITVMPTPSHINRSCGISLRFQQEEYERIIDIIEEGKLEVKGVYVKNEEGYCEIKIDKLVN